MELQLLNRSPSSPFRNQLSRQCEDAGVLFNAHRLADLAGGSGDKTGGTGIDGHITALGHEPHNYVTVYVQVDDIPAYLAKAVGLGGKKIVGPIDIPTGSFAWMSDPEGTLIGLFKPKA